MKRVIAAVVALVAALPFAAAQPAKEPYGPASENS